MQKSFPTSTEAADAVCADHNVICFFSSSILIAEKTQKGRKIEMKPLTFKGGVHPYEGKELSMDRKIRRLRPGKEMAYLLSQHIGAPAVPVVKKGDYVKI